MFSAALSLHKKATQVRATTNSANGALDTHLRLRCSPLHGQAGRARSILLWRWASLASEHSAGPRAPCVSGAHTLRAGHRPGGRSTGARQLGAQRTASMQLLRNEDARLHLPRAGARRRHTSSQASYYPAIDSPRYIKLYNGCIWPATSIS